MEHCLVAEQVCKTLARRKVLQGVSFTCRGGEVCGLVGQNGAGKSVLLRTLCGLVTPSAGRVLLDGKPLSRTGNPANIGILIEHAELPPELSVGESLRCLAALRKTATPQAIRQAILAVGLDPDCDKPYGRLSLGMRQRALLAQAIFEQPDFLLLDEPTNGIDRESIPQICALIRSQAERGAVVLVASHLRSDLAALCDRCLELREGRIADVEPPC